VLAPKRSLVFVLDVLLVAAILMADVFFWELPAKLLLVVYLMVSLICYFLCLFLSTGFFIKIDYDRLSIGSNILALLKGVISASLIILVFIFFFYKPYRIQFFYFTIYNALAIWSMLTLLRVLERKFFWPKGSVGVLILGEGKHLYLYLGDILRAFEGKQIEVIIALPTQKSLKKHPKPLTGAGRCQVRYIDSAEACKLLEQGTRLSAVVLDREPLAKEFFDLLPLCYRQGYSVLGIGPFYELICNKVPLFQVGESWLAHTIFREPTLDLVFAKRLFDLAFSAILLLIFFPLGLVIALAIKLDSSGPVFYIQERTGQFAKNFKLIKFRSMRPGADVPNKWPNWQPQLVTRVGAFLRKTGLDEFPQLINIFKGDMSFVGPRPARPWVTQRHIEKVPFFAISLALRPGVTGWAQIHQGQDSGDASILERIRYNLYYAKKFSLLLDLEIILKTVRIFLLKKKPGRTKVRQVSPVSATDREYGGTV
jgi:lipopolysaccharide/colanic/teichoic acid biosynthesis glycosyltransferase